MMRQSIVGGTAKMSLAIALAKPGGLTILAAFRITHAGTTGGIARV